MNTRRQNNPLLYSNEIERANIYNNDVRKRSLSPGASLSYYQNQTNNAIMQGVPQGQILFQGNSSLTSQLVPSNQQQMTVLGGTNQGYYQAQQERVVTQPGVSFVSQGARRLSPVLNTGGIVESNQYVKQSIPYLGKQQFVGQNTQQMNNNQQQNLLIQAQNILNNSPGQSQAVSTSATPLRLKGGASRLSNKKSDTTAYDTMKMGEFREIKADLSNVQFSQIAPNTQISQIGFNTQYSQMTPLHVVETVQTIQPVQSVIQSVQPVVQTMQPVVVQPIHYIQKVVPPPVIQKVEMADTTQWEIIIKEKDQEIEMWKSKYSHLEIHVKKLTEKERIVIELETRIRERDSKIISLETRITQLQRELDHIRTNPPRVEVEKRSTVDIARLSTMEQEIARLNATLKNRDEDLFEAKRKIGFLEDDLARLNTQLSGKDESIYELKRKITLLEQEISRLNAQLQGGDSELSEYRRKIAIYEQEVSKITIQIQNLEFENADYRKRISILEQELSQSKIKLQQTENDKETMRRKKKQKIANLRTELARLKAQFDSGSTESLELRKKISRYEEIISEYHNMDLKIKLLTEEVNRLNEELEYANQQTEMYKRKFVEFSNMTDKLNNALANYVVMGILVDSLQKRVIELSTSGFKEEKRSSIVEQLKNLEQSQRGSIYERKIIKESVEYV